MSLARRLLLAALGAAGVGAALPFGWALPGAAMQGSVPPGVAVLSEPEVDLRVEVPETLRRPALPLSEEVFASLRQAKWDEAHRALSALDPDQLVGPVRDDLAFLVGWTAVRSGRAADAVPLLPRIEQALTPPRAYVDLLRGELLRADGRLLDALAALEAVPDDLPIAARAAAERAEVLHALGRTREAAAAYEAMASAPDPSPGTAFALLALAKRRGLGSPESYALLRRIWTWYPGSPESAEAERLLAARYADRSPTPEERVQRADLRVEQGAYDDALALTAPLVHRAGDGTLVGCRVADVRGRAWYKKNQLSKAIEAIGDAGARCVGIEGGRGERSLYNVGQARFRKGEYAASAAAYTAIADDYPHTSFADDGLTRAGIALFEAGDTEGAIGLWRRALAEHPDGDTVPEAAFRLAFTLYDTGRTAEAIEAAEALAAMPLARDENHVTAGRYWAARWRAWPDVADPRRLTASEADRRAAADAFEAMLRERPFGWYAVLAWARLAELDPPRARALAEEPRPRPEGSWRVAADRLEDGPLARGVALARLGLVREARAEWDRLEAPTHDEMAWTTELRTVTGDWLLAHEHFARWLRSNPVDPADPGTPAVLRVAYPDRYWDEVRAASEGKAFPPRMFHALVREESMFNKDIRSFAGARGLAQLMPATAALVAKQLGMSRYDVTDPRDNLTLGARYLHDVLVGFDGNPALAMAGYNAGPANVRKWVETRGNLPLDEFVERIPFRETRGYVKRVTSTWQTMRWAFDHDEPAFVDLSRFNRYVRPDLAAR